MLQLHTALSRSGGFLAFRICFTANVWLKASQVEDGARPLLRPLSQALAQIEMAIQIRILCLRALRKYLPCRWLNYGFGLSVTWVDGHIRTDWTWQSDVSA